jgi:hypothetical protein
MKRLLANVPRPTSHSDTAGPVSAARTRIARIARVAAMPMVAFAALAGATGTAHAATDSVGTITASVYCTSDVYHHTSQITVDPYAIENAGYSTQWVVYRYGYYTSRGFAPSGWSSPVLVDAVRVTTDAYGNLITLTNPALLPPARWNVAFGGGRIPVMYVQAGFWDGRTYEYSAWVAAGTYYSMNASGQGDGGSPVPCSV